MQIGMTPLHMSAYNGHIDSVRLLLDRGADKGSKDAVRGGILKMWVFAVRVIQPESMAVLLQILSFPSQTLSTSSLKMQVPCSI